MCTAVRGVVYAYYDLAWEQVLNSEIPLIDLATTRRPSIQVAGVAETPLRQSTVLSSGR